MALSLALTATAPAAVAAIEQQLGDGLPLVLKDGRIANVTVHAIPFTMGSEALDAATALALENTFRPLATDCFLTAQAIGHVSPGVGRDGETLEAHRLARSRADGIQDALAAIGMPEGAVASVWDWQFLVQEPQVTVWIFSLNVGDDCDGTPLDVEEAIASDQVELPDVTAAITAEDTTSAEAQSAAVPDGTPLDAAQLDETLPDAPTDTVDDLPRLSARETNEPTDDVLLESALAAMVPDQAANESSGTPAIRAADPLATAAVAPVSNRPEQMPSSTGAAATVATAPTEPSPTESSAAEPPLQVVSTPESPTVVNAALDPTGVASEPDLVITFDVNSSFFPAAASRQLRNFLDSLPQAGTVQLVLSGAIGTGDVRGASGEEAMRYNMWMAERRVQRVAEWMRENASGRSIMINEELMENDPSREVRIFTKSVR